MRHTQCGPQRGDQNAGGGGIQRQPRNIRAAGGAERHQEIFAANFLQIIGGNFNGNALGRAAARAGGEAQPPGARPRQIFRLRHCAPRHITRRGQSSCPGNFQVPRQRAGAAQGGGQFQSGAFRRFGALHIQRHAEFAQPLFHPHRRSAHFRRSLAAAKPRLRLGLPRRRRAAGRGRRRRAQCQRNILRPRHRLYRRNRRRRGRNRRAVTGRRRRVHLRGRIPRRNHQFAREALTAHHVGVGNGHRRGRHHRLAIARGHRSAVGAAEVHAEAEAVLIGKSVGIVRRAHQAQHDGIVGGNQRLRLLHAHLRGRRGAREARRAAPGVCGRRRNAQTQRLIPLVQRILQSLHRHRLRREQARREVHRAAQRMAEVGIVRMRHAVIPRQPARRCSGRRGARGHQRPAHIEGHARLRRRAFQPHAEGDALPFHHALRRGDHQSARGVHILEPHRCAARRARNTRRPRAGVVRIRRHPGQAHLQRFRRGALVEIVKARAQANLRRGGPRGNRNHRRYPARGPGVRAVTAVRTNHRHIGILRRVGRTLLIRNLHIERQNQPALRTLRCAGQRHPEHRLPRFAHRIGGGCSKRYRQRIRSRDRNRGAVAGIGRRGYLALSGGRAQHHLQRFAGLVQVVRHRAQHELRRGGAAGAVAGRNGHRPRKAAEAGRGAAGNVRRLHAAQRVGYARRGAEPPAAQGQPQPRPRAALCNVAAAHPR